MAQLDIGYIVRDGLLFLGHREHVARGHEEERGLLVDKAGNEPGAGNAINAGLLSSDPFHGRDPFCGGALQGFALLVWPRAALSPCASLTGSSFAQKCM